MHHYIKLQMCGVQEGLSTRAGSSLGLVSKLLLLLRRHSGVRDRMHYRRLPRLLPALDTCDILDTTASFKRK